MIRGGILIVFLSGAMIAAGCGGSSGESTGGNVSRPVPNTSAPVTANPPAARMSASEAPHTSAITLLSG